MINYFSLPDFLNLFLVNRQFEKLLKVHPEYFIDSNIKISSLHGSFPYTYMNGGFNSNIGSGMFHEQIVKFSETDGIIFPIRINLSNINILPVDYTDTFTDLILQQFNTGQNFIEVSDFGLLKFISEKYQYYKFVFSKNADLMHEIDLKLLDTISSMQSLDLIEVPMHLIPDILTGTYTNNMSKLEVQINDLIEFSDKQKILTEQLNQYNYSIETILKFEHTFSTCYSLNDVKQFNQIGINHFKIIYSHDIQSILQYVLFLIDYFIKDEFKMQTFKEFEKGGLNR